MEITMGLHQAFRDSKGINWNEDHLDMAAIET